MGDLTLAGVWRLGDDSGVDRRACGSAVIGGTAGTHRFGFEGPADAFWYGGLG